MNNKDIKQEKSKAVIKRQSRDEFMVEQPKKSKKEILERLRDPSTSEQEKSELLEMLYEGIDVK